MDTVEKKAESVYRVQPKIVPSLTLRAIPLLCLKHTMTLGAKRSLRCVSDEKLRDKFWAECVIDLQVRV